MEGGMVVKRYSHSVAVKGVRGVAWENLSPVVKPQKIIYYFNGSVIKALTPPPPSSFIAVGTSASEKKGLKIIILSLMARPLPLLNGTPIKKELFFAASPSFV